MGTFISSKPEDNLASWIIDGSVGLFPETKNWIQQANILDSVTLQLLLDAKIKYAALLDNFDALTALKNIKILNTLYPEKSKQLEKIFSDTVNHIFSQSVNPH